MSDHIVELPRDPLSLLRDGAFGGVRVLALETACTLGQLACLGAPATDHHSDRPRDHDERPDPKNGPVVVELKVCVEAEQLERDQPQDRPPQLVVRAEAPGQEQDDEERRVDVVHRLGVDREHGGDSRADGQRRDERRVSRE